ncbi:hypothetical protein [Gordonia sp. (in: high G+C Gram-positive bacteria)]|uniref:hypothetical protein n=1 Tax=Gordonia sp. (in: high G+C Gram-positive bacteria) TaxID=84139 RepID=UPI00333F4282
MTGTDPAVEAAQRAWDDTDGYGFASSRDAMEESARAALAPIRALHTRHECPCGYRIRHDTPDCTGPYCTHCGAFAHWPCDTARLIYSETELTND